MARIVVAEFMSLDGVIQDPAWTFPYWNDEIGEIKQAELFASGALLLGRVTYEGFAEAWPDRTDEDGYAERINSLPKHVATTTLKDLEWNAQPIKGDLAEVIALLKQQGDEDLLVFGSGKLVQFLMRHKLVDVYRLVIYPVILGSGQRLFEDGTVPTTLEVLDTKTTSKGVTIVTYAHTGDEVTGVPG